MMAGRRIRVRYRASFIARLCFNAVLAACVALAPAVGSHVRATDLPFGATVTNGDVSISAEAGGLSITQSSQYGIVGWDSFSIGAGNRVSFDNGTGATLNRVTGSDISSLHGQLTATGDLFLINRNGILIGADGVIETGGRFVTSTLDIDDEDFLNGGDNTFFGESDATVHNLGKVASLGGDVAFIAHTVINEGVIEAESGTVGLIAGREVLMRDAALDDGLFAIKIGDADSSVTEQGMIAAAAAELRANGGNVYALAGNSGGTISASGVSTSAGRVFLTAEDGGTVTVEKTVTAERGDDGGDIFINAGIVSIAGLLDATGGTGEGGSIDIGASDTISLAGARLEASGATAGGTVRVGGEFQGGADLDEDEVENANYVIVDADTVIDASALHGEGGMVVLWSEEETGFAGAILATGGEGGFAEVSSHGHLIFTGAVDTGGGTLLLDPENIVIGDASGYSGYSQITVATLMAVLKDNDVMVTTSRSTGGEGHIVVTSDVLYGGGHDLTLLAHGNILLMASIQNYVDPNVALDSGDITLVAGWDGSSGFTSVSGGLEAGSFDWSSFTENSYGNSYGGSGTNHGSIIVGDGNQTSGIAVGARSGAIRVYGYDVQLTGGATANAYAQIGFHVKDQGSSYSITGDIVVDANNDVALTGGSAVHTHAQIGHVGAETNSASSDEAAVYEAAISVTIGNDLNLEGGSGIFGYAQIGHGGTRARGDYSGATTVSVGGGFNAEGGIGAAAHAQIGHGGITAHGSHSGAITVDVGDGLNLAGGNSGQAYAQIGHGGLDTDGNLSGAITVDVDGDLSVAGGRYSAYAQLGHGNAFGKASGERSGAVTVTASGEASLVDGSGSDAIARLGHVTRSGTISNADVWFQVATLDNDGSTSVGSGGVSSVRSDLLGVMLGGGDATIVLTDSGLAFDTDVSINTANRLVIRAANDLTFNSDSSLANSGTGDIILATDENFHNDSGSKTPIMTRGRWLAYSARPDQNRNDIEISNYDFTTFGVSFSGADPSPSGYSGSGLIHSAAPTVTFTADDHTMTYGQSYDATDWSLTVSISGSAVTDTSDYVTLLGGTSGIFVTNALAASDINSSGFVNVGSYTGTFKIDGTSSLASISGLTIESVTGTLTVDPASLTVTADDQTAIYDGAVYDGGFTVGYSDFVAGEDEGVLSGVPVYSAAAITAVNAGSYTIVASGLTSSNYDISFVEGTLTIDPASLTVTADDHTVTYDGATHISEFSVGYSGFVTGEDASVLSGAPDYDGAAITAVDTGSYAIGVGGLTSSNYDISFVGGTLTIDPASLTVTADDQTATYDGAVYDGGFSVRYAGFVTGEDASDLSGTLAYDGAAITAVDAGSYAIGVGGLTSSNYDISFVGGTLTIDPASLTVTADDQTATYDGAVYDGGFSVRYAGFVTGEDADVLSGAPDYDGAAITAVNAGSYAIGASGLTSSNYDISFVGGTLTITQASLSLSLAADDKVYDGTTAATGSFSGWLLGDAITVNYNDLSFGSKDVGAGKTVTASDLSISGTDAGNYTLSVLSVTGSAGITQASLLLSLAADDKVYDSTTAATGSFSGWYSGDDITVSYSDLSFGSKDVGAGKTVTASDLSISGTDAGNYTLSAQSATGSAAIRQASLTVTADDQTAIYDGAAYDDGFSVTYTGFVGSEDASVLSGTLAYGGAAATASDAGSYAIAASGLSSSNYDISFAEGTLTITQASLTITADDQTATYDGAAYDDDFSVTYAGFVDGEDASVLSGAPDYGGAAITAVDAGSYAIGVSGLASSNYDISFVGGMLTIDPASLTVTADDQTATYDGAAYDDGFSVSYSGFVTGEDADVLSGAPDYGGAAITAVDAGSYAIGVSGLASSNYDISFVGGMLTIDPASLTVTADDQTATYDGEYYNDSFSVRYAGFVDGEDEGVLSGAPDYGGAAITAVNAGSYAIGVSGQTSSNYDISFVDGTLTITQASLTVTADDQTATYDGAAYDDGFSVSYSGFVGSEDDGVLSGTLAYDTLSSGNSVDAGSYAIAASGLSSSNYDISFVGGTLTIERASLTVTADDQTAIYDGAVYDGGFSVGYSGFVDGESEGVLSGVLAYGGAATTASDAGSYAIAASGLSSSNYNISFVEGMLTITQASLTVTADDQTVTYDGAVYDDGFSVTYAGFVGSDDASVLSGTLDYGGAAATAVDAGSYAISASGLTSSNYDISFVEGTLTIDPAVLFLKLAADNKVYDGTKAATGSFSGWLSGDDITVSHSDLSFDSKDVVDGAKSVRASGLSISGADAGNYTLSARSVIDDSAAITQADLSLRLDADDKAYDGTRTATGSFGGWLSGDDITISYSDLSFDSKDMGDDKTVTASDVSIGGADAGNYALSARNVTGFAAITLARLPRILDADNEVYPGTSAKTGSFSSWLSGDDNTVSYSERFFDSQDVGANKTLTPSGLSVGGPDAGNNTLSARNTTDDSAQGTPTNLSLTLTADDKVYDGTTAAAGRFGGWASGDDITVSYSELSFDSKNAGANKTVTARGLSISGADAGKYRLSSRSVTGFARITKASLSLRLDADDKVYDGTRTATGSFGGWRKGDDITVNYSDLSFGSKDVGTNRTVTARGLSISGADAGNYVLSARSVTGSATIWQANLSLSFDADARAYDGTRTAAGSFKGWLSGDDIFVDDELAIFRVVLQGDPDHQTHIEARVRRSHCLGVSSAASSEGAPPAGCGGGLGGSQFFELRRF